MFVLRWKVIKHSLILRMPDWTNKFDWNYCSVSCGSPLLARRSFNEGGCLPLLAGIAPPNFGYIIPKNAFFSIKIKKIMKNLATKSKEKYPT